MNTIFKKVATGTAVLALSTTVFAGATFAAGTSSVIDSGTLKMDAITVTDFKAITLDGTTQEVSASIETFTITDATGFGAGWKVTANASQFSQNPEGPPLGANPLSIGSLVLDESPTINKIDTNSDDPTKITKSGRLMAIDSATSATQTILSAPVGEGMGSYKVDEIPMTLTLKPSEVYEGTYSSTITVTLTATP